jgi:arsenate reductase
VEEFAGERFDYVLTVCDNARESCPAFPGGTIRIHHNFVDPAASNEDQEERLALFRRVRDQIRGYLRAFPPI